jgi:hypothetical protein
MLALRHLMFDECVGPLSQVSQSRPPLASRALEPHPWKPIREVSYCELVSLSLKTGRALTKLHHIYYPSPRDSSFPKLFKRFPSQRQERVNSMRLNRIAVGDFHNYGTSFPLIMLELMQF